jgi:hypothetical protein
MRASLILLAGLVLGAAPAVAASDEPQPGMMAPAAPVPDATIGKAGAALRDVATLQQKYQPKMDQAASPKEKQGLSDQANAEAVQAIQSHGLSVQEYSNVMRTAQNDPKLKQRLLDAATKD